MVMSYLMALGMVYVMALVVDALAPTFGGRKNFLAAFKLVAYSCTAAFVGGIFNLIPSLAVLGLLAAIYSIYLLYLGLPVLMGNPDDKSPAYTAVVVVVGIVASLVIGALSAALSPGMGMGMGMGISNYYGAFGTFNSSTGAAVSGYGRNFVYDERMEDHEAPPYFPSLNTFTSFTNDVADKVAVPRGEPES